LRLAVDGRVTVCSACFFGVVGEVERLPRASVAAVRVARAIVLELRSVSGGVGTDEAGHCGVGRWRWSAVGAVVEESCCSVVDVGVCGPRDRLR